METAPIVPSKKLEPGIYQGTPKPTQSENPKQTASRLIRTMNNDAAEAIRVQNETAVSIAMAEQKKAERALAAANKEKLPENTIPAPKRISRIFIIAGLLLIIAIVALAYTFLLPKLQNVRILPTPNTTENIPVTPAPMETKTPVTLAPSLVVAQSEKRFDITKETLAQISSSISEEQKFGTPASSIKNLYFTESATSGDTSIATARLLDFAGIKAPEIIVRSLEKAFMAGFVGEGNGGAVPFFIFKVSGHETGVAGLLEWEVNLPGLFSAIFGTQTNQGFIPNIKFRDIVVSGKDARVLNVSPSVTITYAFANLNTIVITQSISALETLLPLAAKI